MKTYVLAKRHGQQIEFSINLGGLFEAEKQPAADAYTLNAIRDLSVDFAARASGGQVTVEECTQTPDASFVTTVRIE